MWTRTKQIHETELKRLREYTVFAGEIRTPNINKKKRSKWKNEADEDNLQTTSCNLQIEVNIHSNQSKALFGEQNAVSLRGGNPFKGDGLCYW